MTQHDAVPSEQIADARRRELAVEHLPFGTIRFFDERHSELLDELEGSVGELHSKQRITTAVAAGVLDRLWSQHDLVEQTSM